MSSPQVGDSKGEDGGGELSALTTTAGVSKGPGHSSGQRGCYTRGSRVQAAVRHGVQGLPVLAPCTV